MQVSHSLPGITLAHRWSQSIKAMASICNDEDVIPNFFVFSIYSPLSAVLYKTYTLYFKNKGLPKALKKRLASLYNYFTAQISTICDKMRDFAIII